MTKYYSSVLPVIAALLGFVCICSAQIDTKFSFGIGTQRPGQSFQDSLDQLGSRIYNLQTEMSKLFYRIGDVERKQTENREDVRELRANVQKLDSTVRPLKQGMDKLNRVDQIWRNNFKIVNNVFDTLRKKFVITTESIRFGN